MSRPPRPFFGALVLLAALLVAPLSTSSLTPPAQAHADLVTSTPEAGASISAPPSSITLTFTDDVPAEFATVVLTVGDGPARTLPVVNLDDPTTVEAVLDRGFSGGQWRVDYRVTSADGHPIQGRVAFSVATATPGAATTPGTPTSSTGTTPPDSPTAASDDPHSRPAPAGSGSSSSSRDATLPAAGGGLALLLVSALVLARRRRSRGTAPS